MECRHAPAECGCDARSVAPDAFADGAVVVADDGLVGQLLTFARLVEVADGVHRAVGRFHVRIAHHLRA